MHIFGIKYFSCSFRTIPYDIFKTVVNILGITYHIYAAVTYHVTVVLDIFEAVVNIFEITYITYAIFHNSYCSS